MNSIEAKRSIPFARPCLGEEERAIAQTVLEGHVLVHGPRIHEFEDAFAKWTGAPGAVAVSSCTAGLHLAYFHLGIGAGDEVIVPAMTHVATAHAVEFNGATPVFVDAEPRTGNLDIEQVEALITPQTRAISLVHYLGFPVNMDRIREIAERHGLFIVEDAALAVGTKFKGVHAGLLGDIGLFSFYPVKHMTTLEGGMVLSKHSDVLQGISTKRAFGIDRNHNERVIPGHYDVHQLGFNYRMNELQAAIGTLQVGRLDDFLELRRSNDAALRSVLDDGEGYSLFAASDADHESSCYCQSIVLDDRLAEHRVEIIETLRDLGVGTSIYYPRPVPDLSYYTEKYGFRKGQFPVASKIAYQSIALPVGPHLGQEDMFYVGEAITSTLRKFL